jgi:hypothetical protein
MEIASMAMDETALNAANIIMPPIRIFVSLVPLDAKNAMIWMENVMNAIRDLKKTTIMC